jgi:hypothetical protein
MTRQTAQAHRINIEAAQQSVFEALSTAGGWSHWFTPQVSGDFTDGSEIVCRLNGRSPVRLRVTSVRPGSAIAFEALEGPFAAPGATTTIQLASADDGRTAVTGDKAKADLIPAAIASEVTGAGQAGAPRPAHVPPPKAVARCIAAQTHPSG